MADPFVRVWALSGEFEIPRVFDKYEVIGVLGRGSTSTVLLIRQTKTNEEFACKVVSRSDLSDYDALRRFEQEVRVLEQVNHPGVVRLIEVIFTTDNIFVIMEYCSGGDLWSYIAKLVRLDLIQFRPLFARIVAGLLYLHEHGIAHRDIKPENILLDSDLNPKIADFGLCHISDGHSLTTRCGTAQFVAPEILKGHEYNAMSVDVWSLGVVLYTLTTGSLPWNHLTIPEVFGDIISGKFEPPPRTSPELQSLILGMMCLDPQQRLTLHEVAQHPWLEATINRYHQETAKINRSSSESLFLPLGLQRSRRFKKLSLGLTQGVPGPLIVPTQEKEKEKEHEPDRGKEQRIKQLFKFGPARLALMTRSTDPGLFRSQRMRRDSW
jgi:serine/threonine protein kinase